MKLSEESAANTGLGRMIDDADIKHEGMILTSFYAALKTFALADTTDPFEQLVGLATALEGVILGGSMDGVGLTSRLSSRVSALLAADRARSTTYSPHRTGDLEESRRTRHTR
ncbi:hypothetical protein [Rhodococcus jostii]|uniref:hypothetical protein n=1 Tax=Rhodococcus jostii TaxID=132919 RepID=UPI000942F48C|nr:hypothetical protein [Rhodococcus jostii]